MAKFGYQVLGFGSSTPVGGPGTWANAGDTIHTLSWCVTVLKHGSAGVIAGGQQDNDTCEDWNGTAFSSTDSLTTGRRSASWWWRTKFCINNRWSSRKSNYWIS